MWRWEACRWVWLAGVCGALGCTAGPQPLAASPARPAPSSPPAGPPGVALPDCSGVYLLSLTEGARAIPLLAPSTWEILQIGTLADGSALIAQHRNERVDDHSVPAGGDRFLRVSSDGEVSELGPFPGLPVPLHAPVGAGGAPL